MNINQADQIVVRTDIVVIGCNPEMADYDNPRGNIYGFCGYILAVAEDGSQWMFEHTITRRYEHDVLARLNTFANKVQAHLNKGGKLDPSRWQEIRPAYASEAYVNGGWVEHDYEAERIEEGQF